MSRAVFLAQGQKTCDDPFRADQDKREGELRSFFERHDPELIGNNYFVLGTVDLKTWKDGLQGRTSDLDQMLEYVADFWEFLKLEMNPGGWFPANTKPSL